MITKPKARKFRIRRAPPPPGVDGGVGKALGDAAARAGAGVTPPPDDGFGPDRYPTAAPDDVMTPAEVASETELDAIRNEGLTGRQLRLARRVAQKHGLPATSDFDAVRLLRKAGIDPFQRASVLDLVTGAAGGDGGGAPPPGGGSRAVATVPASPNLPQTVRPPQLPAQARAEQSHASDILRIQQDIARRRRRKTLLLMARLSVFVMLPTLAAAMYFYLIATPLYATKSEFVIQQAESQAAGGLGSMFAGTQFATSQDSITVQGYLQSRDAMLRLDRDVGFREHFSGEKVDTLQRLADDASTEAAYKIFQRNIKIAYDPTEGVIKMEVSGPSPEISAAWSRALISYAEEQVDQLTQRLRGDQMTGARASFEEAEVKLMQAQERMVELQERFRVLSSEVEVTLITTQISNLEAQLSQDRLALIQMLSNANPNRARLEPLQRRVATLEDEIASLRARLTEGNADGLSLARVQRDLMAAQAEVETRQLLMSQSMQQMETARIEANRQVRYLSVSVSPIAPDEPTYPRAFENTAVAFLILTGIYLLISMTASILREQVSA